MSRTESVKTNMKMNVTLEGDAVVVVVIFDDMDQAEWFYKSLKTQIAEGYLHFSVGPQVQ